MFFFRKIFNNKKFKNNNVILGEFPKVENSKIQFFGSNNILFCEKGVTLKNSHIAFHGNNSLIFLRKGVYALEIAIFNNSVMYIGERNYFNPSSVLSKIILSEEKNVFIGDENLFSTGLIFRNADPHLIYDNTTHCRINDSKSIYIGDHVWFGQNVTILKGSNIHSGSIIAAGSIVANKIIPSNEIWGGIPAKKIKDNISWTKDCVHSWTKSETNEHAVCLNDNHIYKKEIETIPFIEIENSLNSLSTAKEKYEYFLKLPDFKNRFSE